MLVLETTFPSASNTTCSIGIDIGEGLGVQLTRVRYFPNPAWNVAYAFIKGGVVQVSDDNITWSDVATMNGISATIDETVHAGWNSFMITNTSTFRYVRFVHDQKSKCMLS